jgi:hypothetical protein
VPYEQSEEAKRVLDPILKRQGSAEKRHKPYRRKWNGLYSLFRNQAEFRRWYQTASGSERDTGLQDMRREWAADLCIPFAVELVETIHPRMVSQRPRMFIVPLKGTPEENAENMRLMIDQQQQQVDYELTAQETGKSGLIYGLGVEKHYWRTDLYPMPVVERGITGLVEQTRMCGHDDPDCENVDVFDFYWDPFAKDLRNARWAIHRTWRDGNYITKMLVTRKWNNPFGVPPSEIDQSGGSREFDDIHRARLESAGQDDFTTGDDRRHEVWEYHDGQQVVTVVNRKYVVQVGPKPYPHKGLPFVAYRPTTQGIAELPGLSVIEMVDHLIYEMNAFRGLRLDNAKFAVNRTFFYTDGALDPDDLKAGPGTAVPVLGVDPREALFPLPVNDLPGSSYQEEDRLLADIQRASGISDSVTGASSAGETATGIQMVQAAASVRIQNYARRLEIESMQNGGRIWLALNQWRIRNNRTVMVPHVPEPGEVEQKWAQREIPPEGLAGEMFLGVEAGSPAPENPGEQMQKAQLMMQSFRGDPTIDQRQLFRKVLKLFGVEQPDSWLAPEGPDGVSVLRVLEEMGMPREQVARVAEEAEVLREQENRQAQGAQPEAAQ